MLLKVCLLTCIVTERVGRKWALQANVTVFLLGATLMTAASHQLSFICEPSLPFCQIYNYIKRR